MRRSYECVPHSNEFSVIFNAFQMIRLTVLKLVSKLELRDLKLERSTVYSSITKISRFCLTEINK